MLRKETDVDHYTQSDVTRTPTDRLIAALGDPDRLFTPIEMAFLMSSAGRWGYDHAAASLEADPLSWHAGYDAGERDAEARMATGWPPPPYLIVAGIKVRGDQAAVRAEAEADRTQKYAGGAVAVWEADRPDWVAPAGISVRVVKAGSSWVWRDA